MNNVRVTIKEASMRLGMEKRLIEAWVRSGKCPFGEYIREDGAMRGTYYISSERLNLYLTGADMCRCPLEARRVDNL